MYTCEKGMREWWCNSLPTMLCVEDEWGSESEGDWGAPINEQPSQGQCSTNVKTYCNSDHGYLFIRLSVRENAMKKQHSFKQFSSLYSLSAYLYFQNTNKTQFQCTARLNLYSSLSSFCFAYCAQVFVRGIRTASSVTAGKTCVPFTLLKFFVI